MSLQVFDEKNVNQGKSSNELHEGRNNKAAKRKHQEMKT